jgi:hypothetical protein
MDHIADKNGEELVRLSTLHEFPDFVKSANMDQTLTPANLAITTYADPVNKRFPCHNAASTWLSNLFFAEKRASFHPAEVSRVQDRLDHYNQYWRIAGDVANMRSRVQTLHKEAGEELPDESYAWVWRDDETGHKDRRLPLRNAVEVKLAGEWLHKYCDSVPFQDRNVIAKKILIKASSFGASLGEHGEFLEKQAGRGVCDPAEVASMLQDRARLAKRADHKEQILKLAASVKNSPRLALGPDMLIKLACTVDMIDRGLGIVREYSQKIPRPEDVIFKATFTKAAGEIDAHCAMTSGTVYDKGSLSKLALDDLGSLFGTDFVKEVSTGLDLDVEKLAEVAHTLPRPEAELFDNLCQECGIAPAMSKGASDPVGLSPGDLARLTAGY